MQAEIAQIVQQIAAEEKFEQKMEFFNQLESVQLIGQSQKKLNLLLPLLYDSDVNIRRESALLIESLGLKLSSEQRLQYRIALQDFERLVYEEMDSPAVREHVFILFKDKNLRIRAKLLKYIHEKDCQTDTELLLYHYGRGDYQAVSELYFKVAEAGKKSVLNLLSQGSRVRNNVQHQRRQCAQLLEKLLGTESLEAPIRDLLKTPVKGRSREPLNIKPQITTDVQPLNLLISKVQSNGLYLQSGIVFPEINIGPATGRITYRNPGVQGWPAKKRRTEIVAPQDFILLTYDYSAIEPMILLNSLLNEHLISKADIPREDIYLAICPDDRNKAKPFLNSLINGGLSKPEFNPGKFLWKLLPALDTFRSELTRLFYKNGFIETIGKRKIGLDRHENNLRGKIMNRFIQGSAADLFNSAVLELDSKFSREALQARIYFLLYDEVWILCKPAARALIAAICKDSLNAQYKTYNFLIPIEVL